MAPIFGKSIGGGSSILTTPIQVTGLKATGKDGGVALSVDAPTEISYPYLKDYWVVWKKVSDGPIQHPYDGAHMTFAAGGPVSGQALGNLTAGSTLKIVENNVPTVFYVAQQDYQSGLNGSGNVLMLRKDCCDQTVWNNSLSNYYGSCSLDSWFTNTYLLLLAEPVRNVIPNIQIPCTAAPGSTVVENITRQVFALSLTEFGLTGNHVNVEGAQIPIANDVLIAKYNNSAVNQFTRTQYANGVVNIYYINSTGSAATGQATMSGYPRPAFCLPSTTQVSLEPDSQGDYTLV